MQSKLPTLWTLDDILIRSPHLFSLQSASLSPCLLILVYLVQELLRQQLLLVIAWGSFTIMESKFIVFVPKLVLHFLIIKPYSSLLSPWISACPPLVGPEYISKNCFALKPVPCRGSDRLGYNHLRGESSGGSLRGLMGESGIPKIEHFYYKKKNHPQSHKVSEFWLQDNFICIWTWRPFFMAPLKWDQANILVNLKNE